MLSSTAVAVAAVAVLAVVLVAVVGMVRAVHDRLDRLTAAQQVLPRTIAEGAAEQSRSLADVRERLAGLGEATRRLERLGEAVADVQQLLQVPHLRGSLGEVWLEELLRQVLPEGAWDLQHAFRTGERVDAVIRLRGRLVPVDAKFPLDACRRLLMLDGDDEARERRALHRTLKARVDEIADKYIRPDEGTYDFALMYVPAEAVYYEAVVREADDDEGSVTTYAHRRRVVIVSPNTFYAYLAALGHGLRGLEVEARTREILDGLSALELELGRVGEALDLTGRHLQNALKQRDEADRRLHALEDRLGDLRRIEPGEHRAGAIPGPPPTG